jgi:16S rRNA (guanine527-N7)-methyltransferase
MFLTIRTIIFNNVGVSLIRMYFPGIDQAAVDRFEQLQVLYDFWNSRINVISRKDLPNLYINHVLHSLSLAKVIRFGAGEKALDIGTGGGFPGIPLAILNPHVEFTLVDSTGKKIKVVEEISSSLSLTNVNALHVRAEDLSGTYDYVLSRAVSSFSAMIQLSAPRFSDENLTGEFHGLYSLKGGNLDDELAGWKDRVRIFDIGDYFKEDFFRSKKIVFLPARELRAK